MGDSMNEPKKPIRGNWLYSGKEPWGFVWDRLDGMRVISSIDLASPQEGAPAVPNWHVSVSKNGARCTMEEARQVLSDFDALDLEEDNHDPKHKARHFWLQCDPAHRKPCPCKDTEEPIDDKGYVYRKLPE